MDLEKIKDNEVSNTEDGILARLLKKFLVESKLVTQLGWYIDRYLKAGGSKNRTTITKLLTSDKLTWKMFIFLLFDVLRIKGMKITLEITQENGNTTTHSIIVRKSEEKKENKEGKDVESK